MHCTAFYKWTLVSSLQILLSLVRLSKHFKKVDIKNFEQELDGAEVSYEMRDSVPGLLHVKCGKQQCMDPHQNVKV